MFQIKLTIATKLGTYVVSPNFGAVFETKQQAMSTYDAINSEIFGYVDDPVGIVIKQDYYDADRAITIPGQVLAHSVFTINTVEVGDE